MISIIGIVLLICIVKKNAIMMIDFALVEEREHGRSPADAIFEACLLRFRPILMTTMAIVAGMMPIALGRGAGAGSRSSMAVTIIGGQVLCLLLTLLVTHAGRVLTHRTILKAIWGSHGSEQPEHLRVLMGQLRKKIEPDPANPRYLLTEPWVGYRFADEPD